MRSLLILVGAAGASLFTTAWHQLVHRHREIRNHREMCNHVWGPTTEVVEHFMGLPPHYYKKFCPACGEQKFVNEDGSDYIPPRLRKEEDWE